jgi:hypothetical protein
MLKKITTNALFIAYFDISLMLAASATNKTHFSFLTFILRGGQNNENFHSVAAFTAVKPSAKLK